MSHTITWDHDDCEHDPDPDEHWCRPSRADVVCDDPACPHRKAPVGPPRDPYMDESWFVCAGGSACAADDGDTCTPHEDPGVEHTTRGYLVKVGTECNAALFLSEDWDLGGSVDEYRDGPIETEWDDNGYSIRYLDIDPPHAVR